MPRNDPNWNPHSPTWRDAGPKVTRKRSIADVSTNNPPEVNRQAARAEAEARRMQAALKKLHPNRAALKQNAPEINRKAADRMRRYKKT